MHLIEQRGDQTAHEIMDRLAVEFMPPIDREDVTELSMLLDDVIDLIEEVVQHLYMYDVRELHPCTLPMARVIDESVDALAEATRAFHEFKKPKKLGRLLVAVHDKESEADKLYIEAKRDVFANHPDAPASYLIAWNSMFSHMEESLRRLREGRERHAEDRPQEHVATGGGAAAGGFPASRPTCVSCARTPCWLRHARVALSCPSGPPSASSARGRAAGVRCAVYACARRPEDATRTGTGRQKATQTKGKACRAF